MEYNLAMRNNEILLLDKNIYTKLSKVKNIEIVNYWWIPVLGS